MELLDGISRQKAHEIKAFLKRYFPIISNQIPTLWHLPEKLQARTGVVPRWFDCCIKSCMAYTGKNTDQAVTHCSICKEPRFHTQQSLGNDLKARKRFIYIPLIPRLQGQFLADKENMLTTYRASFDTNDHRNFTDIFNGTHYRQLREKEGYLQK